MENSEVPIVVEGLDKSYCRGGNVTPVLRDVNFTVQRGECVFLAGPSGSGKSTLLSILGCILTPDRGTARLLGFDLATLDADRRAILRRDRIGFVFQRFNLIRGLTAAENVAVPLTLRGTPDHQARLRSLELLDQVGLTDRSHSHPRNLSTGQCQRVALARALAGNPDLILADEPTASLDAENGETAMRLLRKLTTEQGKTVVVVTHDHRIYRFADRVLRLDNGRIVSTDRLAAVNRATSVSSNWGAAIASQLISAQFGELADEDRELALFEGAER